MLPNPIKYHIYTGQSLPEPWPYDYVLAAQGLIKRVSTPHFSAALLLGDCEIAGLPDYPDLGWSLTVSRIPGRLLKQVWQHAQQAGYGSGVLRPIEQMYHFHWLDDRWQVSVPKQVAGPGRVRYRGGSEPSVVLDLHSHHQMDAYFSQTDDRDEQGCRLYGVLGQIFSPVPDARLRLGIYGDFWQVNVDEVFEMRRETA